MVRMTAQNTLLSRQTAHYGLSLISAVRNPIIHVVILSASGVSEQLMIVFI